MDYKHSGTCESFIMGHYIMDVVSKCVHTFLHFACVSANHASIMLFDGRVLSQHVSLGLYFE